MSTEKGVKTEKEFGIFGGRDIVTVTIVDTDKEKTYKGVDWDEKGATAKAVEKMAEDNNSGSSGGCYLTTACVQNKGLPDNCLELEVLRGFRDNVLAKDEIGRKAVEEYYKVAPAIVSAVNARPDAGKIWDGVYSQISEAVKLVQKGRNKEAFELYKKMGDGLKTYLN